MKTGYRERFNKDLKKIKDRKLLDKISEVIEQVENASRISDIKHCEKMEGHPTAFRIRIGDYRLGFFFEENIVEFARFLHRKEAYRYFP